MVKDLRLDLNRSPRILAEFLPQEITQVNGRGNLVDNDNSEV